MRPDELLNQLKASASKRKIKNLEIIDSVCREQHERGSKDFSVATIAKIAQERGGPAKSTIHNKTGDDFKGLIKAWADQTGGVLRKVRKVSENPLYSILDQIPDPAVRALIGAVLAENTHLRRAVNLLKANYNGIIDQRLSTSGNPERGTNSLTPALTGLLTSVEMIALQLSISAATMRDEGWSIDEHGRVVNAKGRPVFKVGFATAIQKILVALKSTPQDSF